MSTWFDLYAASKIGPTKNVDFTNGATVRIRIDLPPGVSRMLFWVVASADCYLEQGGSTIDVTTSGASKSFKLTTSVIGLPIAVENNSDRYLAFRGVSGSGTFSLTLVSGIFSYTVTDVS